MSLWAETFPGLDPQILDSGWKLQAAPKVTQTAEAISQSDFRADHWYPATVPGTVLTTLVNNDVYPDPLYGENNRKIPDTLCRESWWYRTTFRVLGSYSGKKIWLNFDGINYSAEIWVNGQKVGTMSGAFIRGHFDISSAVFN